MKSFVLIGFACIGLSCTRQSQDQVVIESKIPFRTLIQDAATFRFEKPWTFVIRSKQDEDGFMKTSLANRSLPVVDYEKDMIICLLAGRRTDSTSSVTIDSIMQKPTALKMYSHISASGGGGGFFPAHIVALPRIDKGVEFDAYP